MGTQKGVNLLWVRPRRRFNLAYQRKVLPTLMDFMSVRQEDSGWCYVVAMTHPSCHVTLSHTYSHIDRR